MSLPLITKLLFLPGLQRTTGNVVTSFSVGFVLEREGSAQTYWGDYTGPMPLSEEEIKDIEGWVKETLAPALTGRALTSFKDMALLVADLTSSLEGPVGQPEVDSRSSKRAISRRDLFTGKLLPAANTSPPSSASPPLPLGPAIRSCLEQALLSAAAQQHNCTVAEYIAESYGLAPATTIPLLHAQIDTHAPQQSLQAVGRAIAAVGYRVPEGDPAEILGDECRILQRFVQGVRTYLQQIQFEVAPHIHLDVRGGIAELYGGQSGKILGAISGLEQAAKPFPLRIENIAGSEAPKTTPLLRELGEFLRFRKMNVALVAGGIETATQAAFIAETTGLNSLHIDVSATGSFHCAIETLATCHELDLEVLLTAEANASPRFLRTLAHVALAAGPAFVGAAIGGEHTGVGVLYEEMYRTLVGERWQD